jgi:6-phosphogluconolactonase
MRPDLRIVDEPASLTTLAARIVYDQLRTAAAGAPFSIALAGGGTPRPVYERLATMHRTARIPWEHVALYFGDERCVPPDDPESNYRLAKEALIDPVGEASFQAVHRIRGEAEDVEAEAERYAALLPPTLDLVLLGIGEDGHTASLFPHDPALLDTERRVLPVVGPKPPPARITLGPSVIVGARRVILLATGHGKSGAVARALEGPEDAHATPAQLARSTDPAKLRLWIVDRAAARGLHAGWW